MSTLHVLMPPIAHADAHPAFHHWLARGDRLADVQNGRVGVLRDHFRFPGAGIPAAALRHHCHAGDAGGGNWLCADPAYVRSEATGARLMACPMGDLSEAEAEALAATLRSLLSETGALQADTPAEWCVRLADGIPPAVFTSPDDALGASLIDVLPEGDAARVWRRLFNEAQVALHSHPVNAARAAARKLPANALWFWGAGAPGAVRVEPLPVALETADVRGEVLLDLQRLGDRESATEWLTTFERWLRTRRFDTIALSFAGGDCYRMRHAHRLRFWRQG